MTVSRVRHSTKDRSPDWMLPLGGDLKGCYNHEKSGRVKNNETIYLTGNPETV